MNEKVKKLLENNREPIGAWGRFWVHGMNFGHVFMARWGMKQLSWEKDWNVLDVGCGGGANLKRILSRCPEGKIYGIDISQESVDVSTHKNQKYIGTRCFITQGTVEDLPYDNESMDAVTAFETIYFWPDIHQAFLEVARVLKPGGRFMVIQDSTDPNGKPWTEYIGKMKIYTPEEISSLMTEAGFAQTEIRRAKSERVCVIGRK